MSLLAASAGLLFVSATTSPLANLSDDGLCAAIKRNLPSTQAMANSAVSIDSANANCPEKRIEIDMTVLSGDPKIFVDTFLSTARSGVCNPQDPTMTTFNARGWRFRYTFKAAGREIVTSTLDCRNNARSQ